jgi:phosphoribosylformimino-5-aminoimidazole carboxamide ribotide isomerase
MELIPVIDLKGGVVVHARRGERTAYRPIETPLSPGSSAPEAVLRGLLRLHPFRTVYVADLDAIGGGAGHAALLGDLAAAFPGLQFWVDNGIANLADASAWLRRTRDCLVIGSESQSDPLLLHTLGQAAGAGRLALSLDFRGEDFQGPVEIWQQPALWPERVIAMTLARVGADQGPDLARLATVRGLAGPRTVYAAGGVRGPDDVEALRTIGVSGALVASALHSGALDAGALARLLA